MICPQCRTDNPQGLRFCRNCGGRVAGAENFQGLNLAGAPQAAAFQPAAAPAAAFQPVAQAVAAVQAPGGAAFFVFKVRTACNECGEPVMFDGPLLSVPCAACQSQVELDAHAWKDVLGFRQLLSKFGLAEGQIRNSASLRASGNINVGWGPQRPQCAGCGALLDLNAAPPGTHGSIRCPACGVSTSTFPPPAWLLAVVPEALQIFGATSASTPAGAKVEVPAERRPVSFACPECGANLKITAESPRILACAFCKVDLYLPDALWRSLHPVKRRSPWVVAFRTV
jgi:Zn finger protein HypA/HybF involved in hydrogenase expression